MKQGFQVLGLEDIGLPLLPFLNFGTLGESINTLWFYIMTVDRQGLQETGNCPFSYPPFTYHFFLRSSLLLPR